MKRIDDIIDHIIAIGFLICVVSASIGLLDIFGLVRMDSVDYTTGFETMTFICNSKLKTCKDEKGLEHPMGSSFDINESSFQSYFAPRPITPQEQAEYENSRKLSKEIEEWVKLER